MMRGFVEHLKSHPATAQALSAHSDGGGDGGAGGGGGGGGGGAGGDRSRAGISSSKCSR